MGSSVTANRGPAHQYSYSALHAGTSRAEGYGRVMDEMTCPKCQSAMATRTSGGVTVHQCPDCDGIFLERAELANLIDAEIDWHRGSGPTTQPLPRITADMVTPPPSRPTARAYVETLFG